MTGASQCPTFLIANRYGQILKTKTWSAKAKGLAT